MARQHIIFLDYLRTIACLMVILVHATEFFYIGSEGISIANTTDLTIVSILNSACRAAVPLFVIASSYLLVPLRGEVSVYAKRRVTRVFFPFVVWSLFYAIVPDFVYGVGAEGVLPKLNRLLYNFNEESGHLWYIYMITGVYLIIPIISPWLQQASKRAEEVFLGIWFITTFYQYVSPFLGGWLGECGWNEFHSLYYYSGYIGYVVLGHYIKVHLKMSTSKAIAVGLLTFLVGYAFTALTFYNHGANSTDYFYVELPWRFCTFNVALMSFGLFLMISKINYQAKWLYSPVKSYSDMSYGIYLCHLFILVIMYQLLSPVCDTLTTILCSWGATALLSWILIKSLSYLPGAGYFAGAQSK